MSDLEPIEAQAAAHGHVLGVWHDADGGHVNRCVFVRCGAGVVVTADGVAEGLGLTAACRHDRVAAERMTGGAIGTPRQQMPGPGGATSMVPCDDRPAGIAPPTARAMPKPRPIVIEPEEGFPEPAPRWACDDFVVPPPVDVVPVASRRVSAPSTHLSPRFLSTIEREEDPTVVSRPVSGGVSPTDRFAGLSLPELIAAGLSVDAIALRTKLSVVEIRRALAKFPCGCGRPGNRMGRCYARREVQQPAVAQEAALAVNATALAVVDHPDSHGWEWFATLTAPSCGNHRLPGPTAEAVWQSFRDGFGVRETARRCGIDKTTAGSYLALLEAAEGPQRCRCGAELRHRQSCDARDGIGGTALAPEPAPDVPRTTDLVARVLVLEEIVGMLLGAERVRLVAERDASVKALDRIDSAIAVLARIVGARAAA